MRRLTLFAPWALVVACASPATPVTPETVTPSAPVTTEDDPAPTPAVAAEDAAAPAAVTGIPSCDAYLEAYRVCEPDLATEIAAGNRRKYSAEEGWVTYMKTTSEA